MSVIEPTYDRHALRTRILHLGFGAFARAHTLLHTDIALNETDSDWGVAVARLHSGADDLTALAAADHLYTVVEQDDETIRARRIGCITQTLHPERDGVNALPDLIANPDLEIITLTITEKGYALAGEILNRDLPGVQHDLSQPNQPRTAIGIITEGLSRRRAAGLSGLTILSCDNLPANGKLCCAAVLDMARAHDPALAGWIESHCAFPCCMVDRIVPALDVAGQAVLTDLLGKPDPSGILCEPFRQWVIEDNFAGPRPDWEAAGAVFTADVAPFEEMKLRMLNGAHSFLAYLGTLAGRDTVAACMDDVLFRTAAHRLMMTEQAPTLNVDADLPSYADRLIERFSNARLQHRTAQIATDGSQKLPQRLLAPIAENLNEGRPWPLSALAVAAWMQFVQQSGSSLQDPMAKALTTCTTPEALLAQTAVFPTGLSADPAFSAPILTAYARLVEQGPYATLQEAVQ